MRQRCPRPRPPIHRVEGPEKCLWRSSLSPFFPPAVPFVAAPELDGDVLTIAIVGELDIATAYLLEEAQRSVQGRYRALRYELAGLSFIDSAGLRALLAPASSHVPLSEISISHPTRAVRRLTCRR
jgi:anti-anti-sigma factor